MQETAAAGWHGSVSESHKTRATSSARVSGPELLPHRPICTRGEIAALADVNTTHQCVVAGDALGGDTPVPC